MIKLKTLLMEADAPKLKDSEKEKARKLGLVWKGKGYGKKDDDHISFKADKSGKLVKVDKDGEKEKPKSTGFSGSDFDRDNDGMEPSDLSDFDPIHDKPFVGTKVKDGKIYSSGPQRFADDVKDMKGEYDLDGGMKIKDGKMFNADGEEMDADDIEDFYYQDAYDGNGINVGIDVKEKPKLDPKQKQRAQDDYNDAIRNIKNPLMAGGIEPYYVDMAADNLEKLGNPDAKVFKDLGKEFRDNLDDDGNPKDEKLDKQIQDKIKQAALDLETDITKETKEGIIKLKDVMRESKVSHVLNEYFRSNILRKLSSGNDWKLDKDLYTWLAKLGVKSNEIEDYQISKNMKPLKKGIEIAVSGKKITLPAKGNRYWEHDQEVPKDVVLNVFKNGKPVWYSKSWKSKDINVKSPSDWGSSDLKTFGLQKYGYQSLNSIKSIPGIVFYQISLEEDLPYMGADKKRQLRQSIQAGAISFKNDDEFRSENKRRYEDAIRNLYDDPEKVKAKIKKAKDYTDRLMQGLIGGKPNKESKALVNRLSAQHRSDEAKAMEVLRDVADAMDRLYDKVSYYERALEDDERTKKQYPDNKYMGKEASKYGKEIAGAVNLITQNKFRGYF